MIYFIRHGQTDWNKLKIMQGQIDIPLNENGITEAKQLGTIIKDLPKFDAVYCSPFKRAYQTFQNLDIEIDDKNFHFDDRLKERSYGDFEGKSKDSFDYNKCWYYSPSLTIGNIEPVDKFFERVIEFIKEIQIKHKNKNVLIISHAGVSRAFKFYFDGLKNEEIAPYLIKNSEIVKYEI